MSKLDPGQRQAFKVMTASFVLTFFNDNEEHIANFIDPQDTERYELEKRKLEKLADSRARRTKQLVALVHGPGGAGKKLGYRSFNDVCFRILLIHG